VQLQDRQIKTPTVLRHRKMDTIFLDLLPLKSKRLGFSEAGKQEKFKEGSIWTLSDNNHCWGNTLHDAVNHAAILVRGLPVLNFGPCEHQRAVVKIS